MIRTAAGLVLLLTSLTLTAQNGSTSTPLSSTTVVAQMQAGPAGATSVHFTIAGCPVAMQASQGIWNHNIAVRKGFGNEKSGQRLTLTLTDSRHVPITAATVRVHGLNGKNRMLEAGSAANSSETATTIHLSFGPQNETGVTDLWVPGFTAVTLIDLQEVSYSDGTTWRVSGSDICRVQPDPIMLITSR